MERTTENPVNLEQLIYLSKNVPDLITRYTTELRKSNDLKDILHATKLEEYRSVLTDSKIVKLVNRNFNNIYNLLVSSNPNLSFYIEGRKKSFVSTENKINLYFQENRSLDDLRDLLGFRIILLEEDSTHSILKCYQIMGKIITYFIKNGFIPCRPTDEIGTKGFDKSKFPDIIVPKKSYMEKDYVKYVKDYVLHPKKKSGYQSLHLVVRSKSGVAFEVQVRTLGMHIHAESSKTAGHDFYKLVRYSNSSIVFDRTKIYMHGYGFSNNQVFDFIGFEKSLQILQKQRLIF